MNALILILITDVFALFSEMVTSQYLTDRNQVSNQFAKWKKLKWIPVGQTPLTFTETIKANYSAVSLLSPSCCPVLRLFKWYNCITNI